MPDFYQEAKDLFAYSQNIRRDLHRHPELGFQEVRTAGIVTRDLGQLGLEVTTGIAKTGVMALLEGARPGPVILLRFDMDALPIEEETGAEYASTVPGVMHACGHDTHVATGLTVARLLQNHREELCGTVKLVFQPAEEGLGGAPRMVEEGVLENPAPVKALALHVWNERPIGWVGAAPGPVMAGAGTFRVKITGKGGHGAAPHTTIDPVLAGAQIVTALQSLVARNIPPLESAVVSVTKFHAGEAFNVIPMTAELGGTVRYFTQDIRKIVHERFVQIAKGVGQAMGCEVEVEFGSIASTVINDLEVTTRVGESIRRTIPDATLDTDFQTMGSEDMSAILEQVPGCYFFVGSANAERGLNYGHHHPKFDVDEEVLPRCAALMAAAAYDLLQEEA